MGRKQVKIKTRLGIYPVNFTSNYPEKGYTVTVPKLRGIVTFGMTMAKAKKMAKEAIELHCQCLLEEGLAEVKIKKSGSASLHV